MNIDKSTASDLQQSDDVLNSATVGGNIEHDSCVIMANWLFLKTTQTKDLKLLRATPEVFDQVAGTFVYAAASLRRAYVEEYLTQVKEIASSQIADRPLKTAAGGSRY